MEVYTYYACCFFSKIGVVSYLLTFIRESEESVHVELVPALYLKASKLTGYSIYFTML